MKTQPQPNDAFRAVRLAMRLSQDELAERMRQAGAPSTTKRTIQRYESGEIANPRPASARALEVVTRLSITSLGFPAGVDAVIVATPMQLHASQSESDALELRRREQGEGRDAPQQCHLSTISTTW